MGLVRLFLVVLPLDGAEGGHFPVETADGGGEGFFSFAVVPEKGVEALLHRVAN